MPVRNQEQKSIRIDERAAWNSAVVLLDARPCLFDIAYSYVLPTTAEFPFLKIQNPESDFQQDKKSLQRYP